MFIKTQTSQSESLLEERSRVIVPTMEMPHPAAHQGMSDVCDQIDWNNEADRDFDKFWRAMIDENSELAMFPLTF